MENLFGIIAFLFGVALLMFSFVNCAAWLYLKGYKIYSNFVWYREKTRRIKKYGPGYILKPDIYHRWAYLTNSAIQYIKDADVQKEYINSFDLICREVLKGGSGQCQK